jgi:hypothetical protein
LTKKADADVKKRKVKRRLAKMTNLERIRQMTAEELAVFLANAKGETLVGASKAVYYGLFGGSEDSPIEQEKRDLVKWLNEECDLGGA